MTEPKLNEAWSEPIYGLAAIPAPRPSAPPVFQAFSAVALPAEVPAAVALSPRKAWVLGAAAVGLLLTAGFAATQLSADLAPVTRQHATRHQRVAPPLVLQALPAKIARSTAPAKTGSSSRAKASKPAKQQPEVRPAAPVASNQPQRSSKFSDEPADPD